MCLSGIFTITHIEHALWVDYWWYLCLHITLPWAFTPSAWFRHWVRPVSKYILCQIATVLIVHRTHPSPLSKSMLSKHMMKPNVYLVLSLPNETFADWKRTSFCANRRRISFGWSLIGSRPRGRTNSFAGLPLNSPKSKKSSVIAAMAFSLLQARKSMLNHREVRLNLTRSLLILTWCIDNRVFSDERNEVQFAVTLD
jgi:hypothetical protein